MNLKSVLLSFGISFLLILHFSCTKDIENSPVILLAQTASEITETSFVANWTLNTTELNSLIVEVSQNKEFTSVNKSVEVSDFSQKKTID